VGELAGKKVLVVEDDPDAAEALQIVLEDEGCTVARAADAQDGLAKASSEKPDVILLDIMMPSGTEGFHFVWNLRKDTDEQVRQIPIIVLTAIHATTRLRLYPDQSDGVYGPGEFLPVQGFLDKPASSEQLKAKIEEVLSQAKASSP
jgi:two-component system alkaline phosphatase synthesis response regulator PhoP